MKYILCVLALSLGVAQAVEIPASLVNQTYNGSTIQGGTYFNSPGSETKFINTAGTGITLNAGQNIRGVEGSPASFGLEGNPSSYTGNGGNIHIQAPDQVVKLNGNIDVRGFLSNGSPFMPGTGGKVTIDAAYLFQNGNIYASGMRGGNVTMNVGGMTMGSNSYIDARSTQADMHMPGGSVTINSTGQVDIQKGAKIDVSGATFERNPVTGQGYIPGNFSNIVISGNAVNMDGVLIANQARTIYSDGQRPTSWQKDLGGGITLVATNGNVTIGPDAIVQADAVEGNNNGRTITVTASNDINQNGRILSKGGDGANSIGVFDFTVLPMPLWGGNAGTVVLNAGHDINQAGRIVTDGGKGGAGFYGGDAGTMIFTAGNKIVNNGVIRAMGGDADAAGSNYISTWVNGDDFHGGAGGNISFLNVNPSGTGVVVTYGGHGDPDGALYGRLGSPNGALGTITAPDPISSTNTLMGVWKKSQ